MRMGSLTDWLFGTPLALVDDDSVFFLIRNLAS